MEIIYLNASNLTYWNKKAVPSVMALGFFDGVHRGHQEVIHTAARKAKEKNAALAVMSFFPHPKTVLSAGKTSFDYLMPLSEKSKVLGELGVDIFYIVEFDRSFASLSAKEFISRYLVDFRVVHAVAGFDFAYGNSGSAHIDTMPEDSGQLIDVTKVSCVDFRGKKISSTWIREILLQGQVEELPDILGRFYEIKCTWDGVDLQPMPHYRMPASGCYAVVIDNGVKPERMHVVVPANQTCIYLPHGARTNWSKRHPLSVYWHTRIRDEDGVQHERSLLN